MAIFSQDLHKLWFVLLKERNMLETYKQYAKATGQVMENKERIQKVAVSMARLKTVIGERSLEYKKAMSEEFEEKQADKALRRKAERIKARGPHKKPRKLEWRMNLQKYNVNKKRLYPQVNLGKGKPAQQEAPKVYEEPAAAAAN